jgi:hypothetical protein
MVVSKDWEKGEGGELLVNVHRALVCKARKLWRGKVKMFKQHCGCTSYSALYT